MITRILVMALLILPVAFADSCFTILDSPSSDIYYWKAVTYDQITASSPWLGKTMTGQYIPNPLGTNQFNIRVDKDCFAGNLITSSRMTGADSGNMYIQIKDNDLNAPAIAVNKVYTISLGNPETPSIGKISEIASGTISGVNYMQKPSLSSDWGADLCNAQADVLDQMHTVRNRVWSKLSYGAPACLAGQGIVDCMDTAKTGTSQHYSIMTAILARHCGIPTRVVQGISEGRFQGIDLELREDEIHYWVEFYDNGWHTFEASEAGATGPSKLETNCQDALDNDKDAKVDCVDTDCKDACSVQPMVEQVVNNSTQNQTIQPVNESLLPVMPKSTFSGNDTVKKIGGLFKGVWDWFAALPLQTKGIIIGIIILVWYLLRRPRYD